MSATQEMLDHLYETGMDDGYHAWRWQMDTEAREQEEAGAMEREAAGEAAR